MTESPPFPTQPICSRSPLCRSSHHCTSRQCIDATSRPTLPPSTGVRKRWPIDKRPPVTPPSNSSWWTAGGGRDAPNGGDEPATLPANAPCTARGVRRNNLSWPGPQRRVRRRRRLGFVLNWTSAHIGDTVCVPQDQKTLACRNCRGTRGAYRQEQHGGYNRPSRPITRTPSGAHRIDRTSIRWRARVENSIPKLLKS